MTTNPPTPLSYSSSPTPPAWARLFMSPLGWPYYLICTLASLCILGLAIVPNSAEAAVAFLLAIAILGFFWLIRLITCLVLRRIYSPAPRRAALRFLLPIAFPLVVYTCLSYELPFRAAFPLSQTDLEREAKALLAAAVTTAPTTRMSPAAHVSKRLGLFHIYGEYINRDTQAVHFKIEGSGLFDSIGLAYATHPLPAFQDDVSYDHFSGDWYFFIEF